jgi:lipid-binding SYLF domain-containing protein
LEAEVYSYSRSKGLFAGITLNGAVLSVDGKANNEFYDDSSDANTILTSSHTDSNLVADLKNKLENFK